MRIIVACIAFALAGCVTPAGIERSLASWEGASLEQVIAQWGPPSDQIGTGEMVTYKWNSFSACPRRLTFRDGVVVAWTSKSDLRSAPTIDCPASSWTRK